MLLVELVVLSETEIKTLEFRFFKEERQWIYLPKSVKVMVSNDGENYSSIGELNNISTDSKIVNPKLQVNGKGRFLKVLVERYGKIPDGKQGGGHEAWLFVDEIIVNYYL